MTRPTARVLTLLEILQAGGTRRVTDLAEQVGVDERTVRRYVGHLIDLGIPVTSVRGRYGGYRLAPGYRMPPLMLTDEEATAVLIGLLAGDRAGLVPQSSASAGAMAKLRRVLPLALRPRLEALLASTSFTGAPAGSGARTDTAILLNLAVGAREGRPVEIEYTDRHTQVSTRVIHPHAIVGHAGRWYVTALDPGQDESRTFRLDRITRADLRAGQFEASATADPATALLSALAQTPWRYAVSFRVHGDAATVARKLPLGLAVLEPAAEEDSWLRVRINAQSLEWLPALIAGLDRPFVIEEPAELRVRMREFAERLRAMTEPA
ncbi:helix-turn-helix transcriptional regulator [Actinoplanes sp. NPDC049599]|uniref:helix-turn-helix transcriptional regulator n=1 Tax=Actinoplanes sp. NPDC049599 TaxID=3363903 RepID=UPI0037A09ED2